MQMKPWMSLRLILAVGVLAVFSSIGFASDHDGDPDDMLAIDIKRVPSALRKGLKKHEPQAFLRVARAFEYGDGVSKDLNFAAKWYERAAYADSAAAKAWLEKEKEREEIPEVVLQKGVYLWIGGEGKSEEARGFRLIRKAADAGYPDAERLVGLAYYEGDDLPKDLDAAIRYLKNAAIHGENVESNHVTFGTLGRIYDDEKSGHFNPQQAYYYLLIATKLSPGYYTADWVKDYDKLTTKQKAPIKKRAAQWKAGMPLWEAGKD